MLKVTVQLQGTADNNSFPYQWETTSVPPGTETELRLVPYFAWGNRRPGQTMRVWIPEATPSS